jgi:hypothetical protein
VQMQEVREEQAGRTRADDPTRVFMA